MTCIFYLLLNSGGDIEVHTMFGRNRNPKISFQWYLYEYIHGMINIQLMIIALKQPTPN